MAWPNQIMFRIDGNITILEKKPKFGEGQFDIMRVTDDNIYMKVPGMKIRDFINSAS
jgi:hypothetical protein